MPASIKTYFSVMAEETSWPSDQRRIELEKTCVSLIKTFLDMKGSVVNKLTGELVFLGGSWKC